MDRYQSPINTVLTDNRFNGIHAGCLTFIRRLCWPKGYFFWGCKAMMKGVWGEGETDYQMMKEEFEGMNTYQGIYAFLMALQYCVKEAADLKRARNLEKATKKALEQNSFIVESDSE